MESKLSIRQPLLDEEVEAQLMAEMKPLWLRGMPAEVGGLSGKKLKCSEIAKKLNFGKEKIEIIDEEGQVQTVENPYVKLRPEYVPYYKLKFAKVEPNSFPLRQKPRFAQGEHRYKVSPKELMNQLRIMNPKRFVKLLNKNVPVMDSFYYRRCRSFLLTLYYTPLRSSEIYERVIDNFDISKNKITIHLLRKKKKFHKETDEPIDIPLDKRAFPLATEIADWLKGEEWKIELKNKRGKVLKDKKGKTLFNHKPWNICSETARNYTKELGEEAYPHFFRFNFVTSELTYPDTSIGELQSKTRLTLSALQRYAESPERVQKGYDKKRIKRFRKMGGE